MTAVRVPPASRRHFGAPASCRPVSPVAQVFRLRARAPRGFTVLEIIVASSIALFVFAVGYLAIHTATRTSDESSKRIRDTESARLFFNMLERDLASAFPGPGNILKKREILGQLSSYAHSANNDPSPLVLTENVTSSTATSDVLQFYCRSDVPGVRDEITLVRYYVNRHDHTLCRKVVVYDPIVPAAPGHEFPDYEDPKGTLTNAPDSDQALFENMRQVKFTFQQWRPDLKQYSKEDLNQLVLDPSSNSYVAADSLLVTLIFTDDYKEKRLVVPASEKGTNTRYQANLQKTYRSYSKVFPIPASFKE